jgi:hypothetical protein
VENDITSPLGIGVKLIPYFSRRVSVENELTLIQVVRF